MLSENLMKFIRSGFKIFTDDIWKDLMAIRQVGPRQKRQNYGGDIFATTKAPSAGYGQTPAPTVANGGYGQTPAPTVANLYNPVVLGVGKVTAAAELPACSKL